MWRGCVLEERVGRLCVGGAGIGASGGLWVEGCVGGAGHRGLCGGAEGGSGVWWEGLCRRGCMGRAV